MKNISFAEKGKVSGPTNKMVTSSRGRLSAECKGESEVEPRRRGGGGDALKLIGLVK